MKPLFTQEEFKIAKSNDKLSCECYICSSSFLSQKKEIKREIKNNFGSVKYCSKNCFYKSKISSEVRECFLCQKKIERKASEIKKSKSGKHFCSQSCKATYYNKNKTHGTMRSKLEIWLEGQLIQLYPNLEIHFNKKNAINSELDIYIPSLKLAFELNGIFHYEPIFGDKKLKQTQNNDSNKFENCIKNQISLCIIDTSGQKYFKESTSKKFLNIIINIINEKKP